ncbi:hypothetical protein CRENBAI_025492, partial [Crenichthys baileyi]
GAAGEEVKERGRALCSAVRKNSTEVHSRTRLPLKFNMGLIGQPYPFTFPVSPQPPSICWLSGESAL